MTPEPSVLDVLLRHGVPFVVIGGHAVSVHGYVRATEDTDVVWVRSPEAEAALFTALTELHAEFITNEIDPATGIERTQPVTQGFVRAERLMMLCTTGGFLDLFDHVPGLSDVPAATLFERAIVVGGVRYASLGWLRKMKHAAGRPKDLLDLENLPESFG
jgi:hypothetical protein